MAFAQLVDAVPFYRGISLEAIGGRGVRWPALDVASELPAPAIRPARPAEARGQRHGHAARSSASRGANGAAPSNGALRLGTYRSIWAAPEVEISPALLFTIARQQVELVARGCAAARHRHRRCDRRGAERDPTSRHCPRPLRRPGWKRRSSLTGSPTESANAFTEPRRRGAEAMTVLLGDVNYFEPWWVQIVKSLLIFAVIFAILPILIVYERKLLGRFQARYGPNRVGPFGLLQPMAEIVKFAMKEPFRPDHVGRLPVPSRPGDLDRDRGRRAGDHPVGRRPARLRRADRPVRDRRVDRPAVRVRARGISFYGIMLGGWASGSKYSFLGSMRGAAPADLLRGLTGPLDHGRGHHRRRRCR